MASSPGAEGAAKEQNEEAMVATANFLYQTLRADARLERYFRHTDLLELAKQLRALLMQVHSESTWPVKGMTEELVEACLNTFDELAEALAHLLHRPIPLGEDPLLKALEALNSQGEGDNRLQKVLRGLRNGTAVQSRKRSSSLSVPSCRTCEERRKAQADRIANWQAEGGHGPLFLKDLGDGAVHDEGCPKAIVDAKGDIASLHRHMLMYTKQVEADLHSISEQPEPHDVEPPLDLEPSSKELDLSTNAVGVEDDEEITGDESALQDGVKTLNITSLNELRLAQEDIDIIQHTWRKLAGKSPSAAGEAFFDDIANSELQDYFTAPHSSLGQRFSRLIDKVTKNLIDPRRLKDIVDEIAFQHLATGIGEDEVLYFRDVALNHFASTLSDSFSEDALQAWTTLFDYIGGAILYHKATCQERIAVLTTSWEAVCATGGGGASLEQSQTQQEAYTDGQVDLKVSNVNRVSTAPRSDEAKGTQHVPTTFPEMYRFNSAVMGFAERKWMDEVLQCLGSIVLHVAEPGQVVQECDVLALRITKTLATADEKVDLQEFKACMLTSLRSLLPKAWSTAHETAWSWLWDNTARLLETALAIPSNWHRALSRHLAGLDAAQQMEQSTAFYYRFFAVAPQGQDSFKQSATYLHYIATRVFEMSCKLFTDPAACVDEVSALGLRHVGYRIKGDLIGEFVGSYIYAVTTCTSDEAAVEGFRWSLGVIARILSRALAEGSTEVMQAINNNSSRQLRTALASLPRGERATSMLTIKVGTQSISPLAWAIRSGALHAAKAMLEDLTTIRADRDRYYYGLDEMFDRHPDVVKRLADEAPSLIPTLLDGLVWYSSRHQAGLQRVNYYVKHLLVTKEGTFSSALAELAALKNPKLAVHPFLVFLTNLVWKDLAARRFLYGKLWLFFTLLVFTTSQSVLEHINASGWDEIKRDVIAGCRSFTYCCSMTQLVFVHSRKFIHCVRTNSFSRVLGCVSVPAYLLQDWQDLVSCALMCSLLLMFTFEPVLQCWWDNHGHLFEEHCDASDPTFSFYFVCSSVAMVFYFMLLIDLSVFSMRVSSFVLVALRISGELFLFMIGAMFTILVFASAIGVLEHDVANLQGLDAAAVMLTEHVLHMRDAKASEGLEDDATLFTLLLAFTITETFFLISLLVAQLNCAYQAIYDDMVGYARLNRMTVVVETLAGLPQRRFEKFVASLELDTPLEFNPGDIGLAGGLGQTERKGSRGYLHDRIRRFGGATSSSSPWPEEDLKADEMRTGGSELNVRWKRLQRAVEKTFDHVLPSGDTLSGSKASGSKTSKFTTAGLSSGSTAHGGTAQQSEMSSSKSDASLN